MRAIFESYTLAELRKLARTHNKEMKITGVGTVKKKELIDKLMRWQNKFQDLPMSPKKNKIKAEETKKSIAQQQKEFGDRKMAEPPRKAKIKTKKELKMEAAEQKRKDKERQKELKQLDKEERKMLKLYPNLYMEEQAEFDEDIAKKLEMERAKSKRKGKAKAKAKVKKI